MRVAFEVKQPVQTVTPMRALDMVQQNTRSRVLQVASQRPHLMHVHVSTDPEYRMRGPISSHEGTKALRQDLHQVTKVDGEKDVVQRNLTFGVEVVNMEVLIAETDSSEY